MGDAVERTLVVGQRVEPVEAVDPEPERLWRRRPGRLLETIERRGRRSVRAHEQRVEDGAVPGVETRGDPAVERLVHLGAEVADEAIKGAEGGQIDAGRAERLDGAVDEIGRVAHRRGRRAHGVGDERAACGAVGLGAEAGADRVLVAVEALRPPRGGDAAGDRSGVELCGEMVGDGARHLARRREVAEMRPGLQDEREQEPAGAAASVPAQEGVLGLGEIIVRAQLGAVRPALRTRVGRALDGRHGLSRNGRADAPWRAALVEGLRG